MDSSEDATIVNPENDYRILMALAMAGLSGKYSELTRI